MGSVALFAGFPSEGLRFLGDLYANNNREWFNANKAIFQKALLAPGQRFVEALGERLQTLSPAIQYDTRTNGSGSMLRIYRDIRFSKDKTPYHTAMRFFFWEGSAPKMRNPGFYFGFDGLSGATYAGLWGFDKPVLAAFREAVADEIQGAALVDVIQHVASLGAYVVGGEHYKRVPRGYPSDHPRATLLRYNGLHARAPEIPAAMLTSPESVDVCFEHCRNMAPLVRWIVRLQADRSPTD